MEGYSRPTCYYSHDSSTDVQVSSTSSTVDDDDESGSQRDRLAAAEKFSKSGVWDEVSAESTLIFGDTEISSWHGVG